MVTKLERPLRREVLIDREPWIVTITPAGLKLTRKGRRKGLELDWKALNSGDAALAAALNASLRPMKQRRSEAPAEREPELWIVGGRRSSGSKNRKGRTKSRRRPPR